jgi:hypothetical protein
MILVASGCADLRPSGELPASVRWGGDVLTAGRNVSVSEAVPGDVVLAGGDVRFSGVADGSYLGAGGEQEIDGRIANSIRAAGGTIRIRSSVGRNVTAAGGEIQVEEGAVVGRNAYLAGGVVRVTGRIEGSLRAAGGEVTLNGPIRGDVVVEAGALTIGPRARIGGNLEYRVQDGPITIDPASDVQGVIRALPPRPEGGRGGRVLFRVARVLAFLLAGGVIVALFPRATSAASDALRTRALASLGFGFLWIVAVPVGIVVVAVTLIGIPLALIAAPLFVTSIYLAPIPAAVWLGDRLVTSTPRWLRWGRLSEFLAGGLVIATVGFVPVVGPLLRVLVAVVGIGAAAIALRSVTFPGVGPRVQT